MLTRHTHAEPNTQVMHTSTSININWPIKHNINHPIKWFTNTPQNHTKLILNQSTTEVHNSSFPTPQTTPCSDSHNSNYIIYNSVTTVFAQRNYTRPTLARQNPLHLAKLKLQALAPREPLSPRENAIIEPVSCKNRPATHKISSPNSTKTATQHN